MQQSNYKPVIVDEVTGEPLWLAVHCAEYVNVTAVTWRNYPKIMGAPQPVGKLPGTRSPLWSSKAVKEWHASRPRK